VAFRTFVEQLCSHAGTAGLRHWIEQSTAAGAEVSIEYREIGLVHEDQAQAVRQ
jgi:hypothetical protein